MLAFALDVSLGHVLIALAALSSQVFAEALDDYRSNRNQKRAEVLREHDLLTLSEVEAEHWDDEFGSEEFLASLEALPTCLSDLWTSSLGDPDEKLKQRDLMLKAPMLAELMFPVIKTLPEDVRDEVIEAYFREKDTDPAGRVRDLQELAACSKVPDLRDCAKHLDTQAVLKDGFHWDLCDYVKLVLDTQPDILAITSFRKACSEFDTGSWWKR